MKNHVPVCALIIAALLGLSACTTRYYIVRHAEKDTSVADIPGPQGQTLTSDGTKRALALCDSLRNKPVRQVFASQYLRTQLTAAPTARARGLRITEYDSHADIQILVSQLRAIGDHDALIVGHSNTIPDLINALIKRDAGISIVEGDYDNFFIVKRHRGLGPVTYTLERRGTYGATSP